MEFFTRNDIIEGHQRVYMFCKFAFQYTGSLSYDRKERGTNDVRNIVFMDFSWLYLTVVTRGME